MSRYYANMNTTGDKYCVYDSEDLTDDNPIKEFRTKMGAMAYAAELNRKNGDEDTRQMPYGV